MTTDSRPAPDGEPSLPDDVWDQFLNDSERAIRSSAPKEPSARARVVARRLREEQERAAAVEVGRSRWSRWTRFGRRRSFSVEPEAWRSGRTDEGDRRARRRSRLRGVIGIALVVALVLFLLAPGRVLSLFGR